MVEFSINTKKILQLISKISIFSHVLSCALGIFYFTVTVNSIIYDFFGYIVFISWFSSILILCMDNKYLNKSTIIGKKINRLSYYFLASFIGSILLLIFGNIFTSFFIQGFLLILGWFMIILGFFIITLFGLHISLSTFLNIDDRGVWNFE
jgi:hypothetical protein